MYYYRVNNVMSKFRLTSTLKVKYIDVITVI